MHTALHLTLGFDRSKRLEATNMRGWAGARADSARFLRLPGEGDTPNRGRPDTGAVLRGPDAAAAIDKRGGSS